MSESPASTGDPRTWSDDKLLRLSDAARELLADGGYLTGPQTDELHARFDLIEAERTRRALHIDR